MNKLKLTSFALLLGLVVFSSCKTEEPEPSAEEARTALMLGTWNTSAVTYDNTNRDWPSFSLTFTDGAYTSTGTPAGEEGVWKTNGTWEFVGKGTDNVNVNKFTRNDAVEVTIVSISETALTMTFSYDETTNGKVAGITGAWKFEMTK